MTSSDFIALMAQVRALSPQEKAALREALGIPVTQLVADRKKEHAEGYIAKMNAILDFDVRSNRRDRALVYARSVLAYVLRREKYTWQEIGGLLGGKNHATIINNYNLMQDALTFPRQYSDLIHIYNKFKTAIENDGK